MGARQPTPAVSPAVGMGQLVDGFTWIDLADKAIRTIAVYLALFVLLRLAGKRQLAQLNTFDFVVVLLLANVVQNAVIGPDDSLIGGLVGAAILIAANFAIVYFLFENPRLELDLRGRSSTLVRAGDVDEAALRRELITPSELEHALRRLGYGGVGSIDEVTLEPEGTLTVTQPPQPTMAELLEALERIERRLAALER